MLSIYDVFPNSYFQASSRQFCFTFSNAIQFRGDLREVSNCRNAKILQKFNFNCITIVIELFADALHTIYATICREPRETEGIA